MTGAARPTTRQAPASVGQRLLWLMEHYNDAGTGMLNQPVALRLGGGVDLDRLDDAYTALVERHEALRTTFTGRGRRLEQVVHEPVPMRLTRVDLRGTPDPASAAYEALLVDLRTPVDPTRWPVRATVWQEADDRHVVCVNMHHLVTDDWSCSVLARDLGRLYRRARGETVELPEPGWQYADWVRWQHTSLSGPRLRRLEGYWQAKLDGARGVDLGATHDPGADEPAGAKSWDVDLAPDRLARLREIARQERATPYAFLLACYFLRLHAATGQDDVLVGSLFANRTRREVADTVGFFVNMVALRGIVRPGETFRDLLRQVRATSVEALDKQSFPYQMLPSGTVRPGGLSPRDVVFQMLDANETAFAVDGLDSGELLLVETGRFPLELAYFPHGGGLRGTLFYHRPRFGDQWAHRFLTGCAALVAAAIDTPDAPLADILAGAEKTHEIHAATLMR